ncbi:SDR family NAD(P)-dependent oxidoreductase [Actinomadura hibisca]|uniref:SDR family NAD(P)-dependent oxidoreductase n=1 Tax=Actinomadura hibisca TaxID=68565 RepID=UPI00082C77BB|nr:SDR family oxidoreductase [Actinomadura hibisca]
MQRLQNRTAIIWGGAGSIGTATARRFAEEGATVYLAGTTEATLKDAATTTGAAGYGVVDVLDEDAVTAFIARVVAETGRLDVSFNVAARGDVHGTPLLEIPAADFVKPVTRGITGSFHTARAAARQMVAQGSGVVVELDSASGRGSGPNMGGTGAADGAKDALVRDLAQEVGPSGVRVVGIWTAGLTDSLTAEKLGATLGAPVPQEMVDTIIANLDSLRMTRKSPVTTQIAATAAFLASDDAAAITATWINATAGMFPS